MNLFLIKVSHLFYCIVIVAKSPKGLIFITARSMTCGTRRQIKTACKAGLATLKILPYRQT
jgi:hypothetical protein